MCIFESDTVKSDCPMQENYEIFKDLIQTVGLLYLFFRLPDPKSEKKIPVNQLIKKIWPHAKKCLQCNFKGILERAVDGVPSQIPTLKFLTPLAPRSPIPGHDLGNRMKILFNMFSIFYL